MDKKTRSKKWEFLSKLCKDVDFNFDQFLTIWGMISIMESMTLEEYNKKTTKK